MNLKTFIAALCIAVLAAGCAATDFNRARTNANLVKNGMTVDEAIAVIGTPPSAQSETALEWRRGNAQVYDATPDGALVFHLNGGRIADVPDGGIFGKAARDAYVKAWAAQYEEQDQAKRERLAREAKKKLEADAELAEQRAERLQRERAEAEAEAQAALGASVTCNVKTTCAKVFALAQIFIATRTDQKIQVVTDSVIQTYNPTEVGKVGASIIKKPQRGDLAAVSLDLMCKDDDLHSAASLCHVRNTALYRQFRPYIEKELSP